MRRTTRFLALAAALLLVVGACGDDDGGVSIGDPWSRPSANMQNAAAVYMSITASSDDSLVSVSVPSDVAGMAEIHETTMNDEGAMKMSPVETIDLPAGETVMLAPGGYHIMLMNLPQPLASGALFDVTLTFANAGEEVVTVEVRDE